MRAPRAKMGLAPENICMTKSFRLLKNALFWRICRLKKQSIMSEWGLVWKFFKMSAISPEDGKIHHFWIAQSKKR